VGFVWAIWRGPLRARLVAGLTVVWTLLYFGRATWAGVIDLLPLARDIPMHRFIGGFHLFAIPLIACGLAPETRGLIDGRRLALMKLGALLINVARAPIVDEMPSSTHSKTATLAEPRSMDGGNTPPPPSRTADRRADRSMNCPMC